MKKYLAFLLTLYLMVFAVSTRVEAGLFSGLFGGSGKGTIDVTSSPEGARVFIDGEEKGLTPLVISDVPRGDHIVRLELDGYAVWFESVYVYSDRTLNLDVQLKPKGTVEKIAFLKSNIRGTKEPELCIINTDGSDEKRILDADSRFPAWSPDMKKMAFVATKNFINGIYIADCNGTNVVKLVGDDFDYVVTPTWSPDGEYIAFSGKRSNSQSIYIIKTDGSELIRLTDSEHVDVYPSYSPDGSKIAFISNHIGWESHIPGGDVHIMNSDGTGLRELVDTHAAGPISWSPSGDTLIFNLHSLDVKRILGGLMVDATTGSIRLSMDESDSHIFSADGKRLIYCRSTMELVSTTTTGNYNFTITRNEYYQTSEMISKDLITGKEVSIKKFDDSVRLQALPIF